MSRASSTAGIPGSGPAVRAARRQAPAESTAAAKAASAAGVRALPLRPTRLIVMSRRTSRLPLSFCTGERRRWSRAEEVDVAALQDSLGCSLRHHAEHRPPDALGGGHVAGRERLQEVFFGAEDGIRDAVQPGPRGDAV